MLPDVIEIMPLDKPVDRTYVNALADALAYEWPGVADRWEELLAALIERIESAGPR